MQSKAKGGPALCLPGVTAVEERLHKLTGVLTRPALRLALFRCFLDLNVELMDRCCTGHGGGGEQASQSTGLMVETARLHIVAVGHNNIA